MHQPPISSYVPHPQPPAPPSSSATPTPPTTTPPTAHHSLDDYPAQALQCHERSKLRHQQLPTTPIRPIPNSSRTVVAKRLWEILDDFPAHAFNRHQRSSSARTHKSKLSREPFDNLLSGVPSNANPDRTTLFTTARFTLAHALFPQNDWTEFNSSLEFQSSPKRRRTQCHDLHLDRIRLEKEISFFHQTWSLSPTLT